ncbi:ABC transporter permease [Salipaludibacillus aurantiacus]|uniref:Dipeptide transport system permease protein n=1 Tax=Salipaludibacillus aurantiacus TaxID=1601833 RepID=A0A1H9SJK6_9BACI|nr:ABC transporter permease [Salipaludibacillus aurantiacus]SER85078.1 dipeptide transport system permease protein [Salipaludibacillus aurantiacus]
MLKYILKRFAWMVLTVWIIITLTFFLMHAIPGDPLDVADVGSSDAASANLAAYYNLDQPLAMQYVTYLKNVVTFDFGPSMTSRSRTVNDMIESGFPASLQLGLATLFFSVISGVVLGVFAALKHNKMIDYLTMILAVIGISIPNFIQSMLFINYIAVNVEFFPIARWGTYRHVILPAIALASGPMAIIARLTRSNMLEVLTQDYIKTAKAKGLSTMKIVVKHALRNALLPVVTIMGALTAAVLTGSFVVERIFAIPGIGQYFVNSISNRDYPMIMATTVIYSTILVVMMFIVDILYGLIDPRIKLHSKED